MTIARALRHRNFRLYFSGQMVSYTGSWMQQVAMGWLAYKLTSSVLLLGVIGFAGQIPVLLVSPLGGLLSDRFNRHRLIVVTQSLSMLQAFILAALALSGLIQVWHLVVMAVWLGVINAIDVPVRQSFVSLLVKDKEDLANGILLNSFAMNSARFLGPALAGLVMSVSSEGMCFLVNGLSYIVVVAALLKIRTSHQPPRHKQSFLGGISDGFRYAAKSPPIRALLGLVATVSLMLTPYIVLMPYYAKEVFHGNAQTLSLLMGSSGLGALAGAMFLVSRKGVMPLSRLVTKAPYLAACAVMAFSFSQILWLSIPLLTLAGFGVLLTAASSNTLIQTLVHDHYRGRIMSFFSMAFLGMAPLGSLIGGALGKHVGVPATLFGGGVLTLVLATVLVRQLLDLGEHVQVAKDSAG